jgi:hypothetical protein
MSEHFVVLTSDMGTEMGFNTVDGVAVGASFPHWCKLNMGEDNDMVGDEGNKADDECKVSFGGSFYIPGSTLAWISCGEAGLHIRLAFRPYPIRAGRWDREGWRKGKLHVTLTPFGSRSTAKKSVAHASHHAR